MRNVPLTRTASGPTGPRRRSLLALAGGSVGAAGVGALLAGCTDGAGDGADSDGRASADERVRSEAARGSLTLLAHYDATITTHPALANRLRPLRSEVARHAEAFGSPPPSASASPSATHEGSRPRRTVEVPRDARKALTALATAERRTADARTTALATASPELARLLASVAASGAAHAYLLAESRT
ncbi:hypothetical protein H8N00_14265 [Streptomyces sp. AC563]|uniref:hypothetical protein n=1 Tax=Streptomyces buecherae TaxID=2763006 RepID=UPI00164D369A|nr:hypothetical protein [Streptomyces buecherae]MBC3990020.1 hypothetical protein [Streptomyces buecherae]